MFHYIYRHIRPDTGEVFYIGRGLTDTKRYNSKQGRNKVWKEIVKLNNGSYTIQIMLDELTLEEAIDKEQEFIELYRKIEDGGTLCNISSGGGSGTIGMKHTEESRSKMRTSAKDRKWSDAELERLRQRMININTNRVYTDELRGKLASKGFKGKSHTEEAKLKLSNKFKGRSRMVNSGKAPKQCIAENIVTKEVIHFKSYAEAEKYTLVNHNHIRKLVNGIGKQCKNWTFKNID